MQLDKINSNNVNFKMALKISPKAQKSLERKPKQFLDNIEKIGAELEKVETYDLFLDEKLKPSVYKKGSTYNILERFIAETKNAGKIYYQTCGDETYIGNWPDIPKTLTDIIKDKSLSKKIFNNLKTKDEITQGTELVKILNKYSPKEKISNKHNTKNSIEKLDKDTVKKNQVEHIINKYLSPESPAKKQVEITTANNKKNIFNKFIDFILG